jgi:two-component system response regulator
MDLFPGVLLVDDDEDYLFVARRAIERARLHADVRVTRNSDEALRVLGLRQGGVEPVRPHTVVVVLLDLRMPGQGGLEVLREIRAHDRTRELPVVVVSTSNQPEDVARSYALGANSYVVKRLDAESPGRYVADTARYWVELNEPSRAFAKH